MSKSNLHAFENNTNRYNFDIKKCALPVLKVTKQFDFRRNSKPGNSKRCSTAKNSISARSSRESENKPFQFDLLHPFQNQVAKEPPKICVWYFMDKNELGDYLNLKSKRKIRTAIKSRLNNNYPRGVARVVVVELMYSVTKFCLMSELNLEQSGTFLSIFYLVHRYFTGNFNLTPEEVYEYYVELLMKHSTSNPPDSTKIFSYQETRKLSLYFCDFYLRFLPLIRLATLPNFGIDINYELEPEPPKEKQKKTKGARGKKEKKGKANKKKKV